MITNPLQQRINAGDREAFKAVYSEYGRGVFLAAIKALGSESDARAVVKQTFLNLHRELLNAADDVDIPVLIRELTDHELLLMKIVQQHGSLDEEMQETEDLVSSNEPAPEQSSARSAFEDEAAQAKTAELPPLERTLAYMQADGALPRERSQQKLAVRKHGHHGGFGKFLLLLLLLVLLWALAGVLMDIHLIPAYDLGYRWFNQTVYPLFSLFS